MSWAKLSKMVPYQTIETKMKFLEEGIHYDDLSDLRGSDTFSVETKFSFLEVFILLGFGSRNKVIAVSFPDPGGAPNGDETQHENRENRLPLSLSST